MSLKFPPITIIPATTDAVTTHAVVAIQQRFYPATVVAEGLDGVEEVPLFFSTDDGENFEAFQDGGSPVVLTATNNQQGIFGPTFLGITKPATANAVGVFIWTNQQAGQK